MTFFFDARNTAARIARCLGLGLVVLSAAFPLLIRAQTQSAAIEAARLNNLGTAYVGQQFLDRAVSTFAAAAKADPSLTLAKVNEAIALMYLQKLPEAEKLLEAAGVEDPKDP